MHVSSGDDDLVPCMETNGYVKGCVKFDFPIIAPVAGKMLAYFCHALDPVADGKDVGKDWQLWGDSPDKEISGKLAAKRDAHSMKVDYVTLHAYCVLPKPYSSARWALRPQSADRKSVV